MVFDIAPALLDDAGDDEKAPRHEEGEDVGAELDQGVGGQVGHDEMEGPLQLGHVLGHGLYMGLHKVDADVVPGDQGRLGVDIDAEDLFRAQLGGGDPQDPRTGTDIQDLPATSALLLEENRLEGLEAHAGRGVLPRAEGHARIHLDDDVVPHRRVTLPCGLDDDVGRGPDGFEIFFPPLRPVGVVDDLGGIDDGRVFGEQLGKASDVGVERGKAMAEARVLGEMGLDHRCRLRVPEFDAFLRPGKLLIDPLGAMLGQEIGNGVRQILRDRDADFDPRCCLLGHGSSSLFWIGVGISFFF